MGYWQAQQSGLFEKGKNGEIIFYPLGWMASEYVIDTVERERSIRQVLKYSMLAGIFSGYPVYKM